MGKDCTQVLKANLAKCATLPSYWDQVACNLDAEIEYARCLVAKFSRALQGQEETVTTMQANKILSKVNELGSIHGEIASLARMKTMKLIK